MVEADSNAMRFVVHGRVQGVGYRAATQRKALGLGLRGWVCNRGDGCVEGLAIGTAAALASLHDWLATGPRLALVTQVEWQPAAMLPLSGFEVWPDRR